MAADTLSPTLPLALDGVTFAVAGRRLIDGISADITAEGRTIILGPNGAGKSLLMRLCHGLLEPTAGAVRWQGSAPIPGRQRQAMVFQRPVMLRRSALDNIRYGLALANVPAKERDERARGALARVGLDRLADRAARVLSGGEQQRLALARAWALNPDVLFLDEPTASIDPAATRWVEAAIEAIHADGTKIVMTTHNLGQARRLGDEILFLDRGRLVERAPAERFFRQPQSAEADAFLKGELPWT
ncbi:MAG: phosphate ABC transporter ATP-binding protein [Burkholderiales bacterium]